MKNIFNKLVIIASSTALIFASKLIKFSFVIGSFHAFFSAINIAAPLAQAFVGLPFGVTYLILNLLLANKFNFLLMSSGLPNFLAGLYWRFDSRLIKIGLPISMMLIFWSKTYQTIAWPYALLWLVPVVIDLLKINNLFAKSLAATFIAHSAGSVIWLFFGQVTNAQWLALIPVVCCERICMAILISSAYLLVQKTIPTFKAFTNKYNLNSSMQFLGR